jgi:hypothetical protein
VADQFLAAAAMGTQVPHAISFFDPVGPLPSFDCINWLISCFWEFHADNGRNVAIHRARFLSTAWSPSGESSPLLFIILWGTTVYLDGKTNKFGWSHPELTLPAKLALRERARLALVGGLQTVSADLATLEMAPKAVPQAVLSAVAARVVPMLQGLVLAMLFYEKAGGQRNMVALVNLIVRMGILATSALRVWTEGASLLVRGNNGQRGRGSDSEDRHGVESWMKRYGVRPPFPIDQSLLVNSTKSPQELSMLAKPDQDDVILLTEFVSCHFYAYAVDAWAADLLGTRFVVILAIT